MRKEQENTNPGAMEHEYTKMKTAFIDPSSAMPVA